MGQGFGLQAVSFPWRLTRPNPFSLTKYFGLLLAQWPPDEVGLLDKVVFGLAVGSHGGGMLVLDGKAAQDESVGLD
jgi:hypothetical protein